jgi:RNA ligase
MVTSKVIWEELKENNNLDKYIEEVPDEFYAWVKRTEEALKREFETIENEARSEYKTFPTEKQTATYFKTCKHTSILFGMYRKKSYNEIIWKRIKPVFEKGFSNTETK